ncbi:hypothetical protein SEEE5646_16492 [Salmonella enterica subsp. enterica serovar Enteritidis str. 50-5646]|nr:hypothetical protein [Salmonella enterica subsp. enterica serovar Derby]ELO92509.1 hypothetical protein SEEE5621_15513 [Salmonella enterica subsp. enterica serovar Enteritidis str. 6.0562-1]ELO97153.1 hypothetical protein SEEE5646_16492 [Salmonella enterica subsp. enterica serovar Enteritidis str. 50-5646]
MWLMSAIQTEPVLGPISTPGSATEKWLNALSLGVVWLILGSIAWYTRPRKNRGYPADTQPETRKHARM